MEQNQREKLIIGGGISAVILIIIGILAGQVMSRRSDLEDSIQRKNKTIKELKAVANDYIMASAKIRDLESKFGDNSQLLSSIENIAHQAGIISPAISVMRTTPNEFFEENAVELKAKELNLEQMLSILNLIEKSPHYMRIKSFNLKTPFANPDLLEISIQISSYSKPQGVAGIPKEGQPQPPAPSSTPEDMEK